MVTLDSLSLVADVYVCAGVDSHMEQLWNRWNASGGGLIVFLAHSLARSRQWYAADGGAAPVGGGWPYTDALLSGAILQRVVRKNASIIFWLYCRALSVCIGIGAELQGSGHLPPFLFSPTGRLHTILCTFQRRAQVNEVKRNELPLLRH